MIRRSSARAWTPLPRRRRAASPDGPPGVTVSLWRSRDAGAAARGHVDRGSARGGGDADDALAHLDGGAGIGHGRREFRSLYDRRRYSGVSTSNCGPGRLPTWKNAVPIQWMTRVTGSPLACRQLDLAARRRARSDRCRWSVRSCRSRRCARRCRFDPRTSLQRLAIDLSSPARGRLKAAPFSSCAIQRRVAAAWTSAAEGLLSPSDERGDAISGTAAAIANEADGNARRIATASATMIDCGVRRSSPPWHPSPGPCHCSGRYNRA
mgnify:CR=1 FL=1